MTEDTRINRNKIRQFKCKNCGGELQLQNKRSQYVACPYCGSVADSSSEAYEVITQMDKPSKFPPMRFIKIGMEGTFNGKMHHVIGRTRRRNTYKEYWVEDGETGYSDETWIFDEWLLISEDATYFTLIEDEEGFTVVTGVIPKYPSLPQGEQIQDFYSGKQQRVQEYGNTEILYYEGESTYLVKPGDKSSFSEYSGGGSSYSAEWRYKDGVVKEIEFFEEKPVSESSLIKAFGLKDKKETNTTKDKAGLSNVRIFLVIAVINILVGYMLPIIMPMLIKKTTYQQNIDILELAKTNGWKTLNDTLKETFYQTKFDLLPSTKQIGFYYTHIVSLPGACISEVRLTDENNELLKYGKGYAYRLKKDNKQAFGVTLIEEAFKINPNLKTININIKLQVNTKLQPKDNVSKEHWFGITQYNSLYYYTSDMGEENLNFGILLIVIIVVYLVFSGNIKKPLKEW